MHTSTKFAMLSLAVVIALHIKELDPATGTLMIEPGWPSPVGCGQTPRKIVEPSTATNAFHYTDIGGRKLRSDHGPEFAARGGAHIVIHRGALDVA